MMRKGILFSGVLHAGIIGATLVAWPHALPDFPSEELPSIPVELITVAEVNNIAAAVTEPEPVPPAEEPAPAPPEQIVASLPEPEVAPEPEPEPEPAPPESEPPKPEPQEEATATPPPAPAIPRRRPQPPPPQPSFDLDRVLAVLDERAPRPPPPPASARVEQFASRGLGAQNAMTLDIEANVRAQVRECWNMPSGAPNPEQLIVYVRVFLARDGDLAQAPQLMPESRAAAAGDSYMNAAAQAALRAVNVCAPYRGLPPDRFEVWREIVLTFDPSKMGR